MRISNLLASATVAVLLSSIAAQAFTSPIPSFSWPTQDGALAEVCPAKSCGSKGTS